MKTAKRLLSLLLCLLLLSGTALAASGKNSQDVVIRKVPEDQILDTLRAELTLIQKGME